MKERIILSPISSASSSSFILCSSSYADDEDEHVHSITLSFTDEVNLSTINDIITPGVPGGWLRIQLSCGGFGYCGFNASDPAGLTSPNALWVSSTGVVQTPIQAVAYGLHFANSQDASLRWDAIFPATVSMGISLAERVQNKENSSFAPGK